jgi:c-di-GMP-binding flagellar brake protein YcgR
MTTKPVGSRIYPRYKIVLAVELQSAETILDSHPTHPIRFRSCTHDISLGGILVELEKNMEGLETGWQPEWFRERYFWLQIMGIPHMPEGLFTKAKVVRFVQEKNPNGPRIGLEFTDLITTVSKNLKEFLESLSRFE